jgi:hypothetical protein
LKTQRNYTAHWTPPVSGWLKLNIDASFIADTNKGSWWAVLREEMGHVVLSVSGTNEFYSAANIAEALACLQGLKQIVTNCNLPAICNLISELCATTHSRSAISDSRWWELPRKWFSRRLLDTQISWLMS